MRERADESLKNLSRALRALRRRVLSLVIRSAARNPAEHSLLLKRRVDSIGFFAALLMRSHGGTRFPARDNCTKDHAVATRWKARATWPDPVHQRNPPNGSPL